MQVERELRLMKTEFRDVESNVTKIHKNAACSQERITVQRL